MPTHLLVADAGPLIALAVADVLAQTLDLYRQLWVPQAVLDECIEHPDAPGVYSDAPGARAIRAALSGPGLHVIAQSEIAPLDPAYAQGLGSGEVAVLAYAAQHQHVVLIDDRRARRIAQRLQVSVVGSGALVLTLKAQGRVPSVAGILAVWQAHGYFVSAAVQAELLRRAGEI